MPSSWLSCCHINEMGDGKEREVRAREWCCVVVITVVVVLLC